VCYVYDVHISVRLLSYDTIIIKFSAWMVINLNCFSITFVIKTVLEFYHVARWHVEHVSWSPQISSMIVLFWLHLDKQTKHLADQCIPNVFVTYVPMTACDITPFPPVVVCSSVRLWILGHVAIWRPPIRLILVFICISNILTFVIQHLLTCSPRVTTLMK